MLSLLLTTILALPAAPSPWGEPFPLKTTTVKVDDSQFLVRGRQVLPRNAKIALLRRAKIEGSGAKGDKGAETAGVLEVSGSLEMKAVTGGEVELRNTWIELTPECSSLYLANVRFVGGGGIRPSKEGPSKTDIFIENVEFADGAEFKMECSAGTVTVSSTKCEEHVSLIGVSRSEKASSKAIIRVIGCKSPGLKGGLTMTGAKSAVVQFSKLGGDSSRFADNGKLSFQGSNVGSKVVEFAYSKPGQFKKATISGCDFSSETVAFQAPLNGKKLEKITIKDCWFSAGDDAEKVLAEQVQDSVRDDASSVLVSLKGLKEQPIGLGGKTGRK